MSAKKKLSNGSLPTQTEHSRRFVRRNSIHTLNCRSGSLKKLPHSFTDTLASAPNLDLPQPYHNPSPNPLQIQTSNFFKQFSQPLDVPLKRSSGSMKVQQRKGPCYQALLQQLQSRQTQLQSVLSQCRKLKSALEQQRGHRRALQEQVRVSQQQVKRLEKRLQKYRGQRQKFERQREVIVRHIQQMEKVKFDAELKGLQSYREKIMAEQVGRLRGQLQKSRGNRERELLLQLQKLQTIRYGLQSQIKSAGIGKLVLSRQLQQNQQQMQEIRQQAHKSVVTSYQYVQLRQRYRRLLIDYRELREEMSLMERSGFNNQLSNTFALSEVEDTP